MSNEHTRTNVHTTHALDAAHTHILQINERITHKNDITE